MNKHEGPDYAGHGQTCAAVELRTFGWFSWLGGDNNEVERPERLPDFCAPVIQYAKDRSYEEIAHVR